MKILRADTASAQILTNITIRSKSYWDYSPQQIKDWIKELTITWQYIKKNEVYLGYSSEGTVGYYSFFEKESGVVKLDNLFVDPKWIGQGFGKILMKDFLEKVVELGYKKVTLDADPNAELFYKKWGFETVGQLPTSIENRFLPIMEKELS